MSRADRRREKREQEKTTILYHLTAKQMNDIRENTFNECEAELTKRYDKKLKALQQVAVNRALMYVLGLCTKMLYEECNWSMEECNYFFEWVRQNFNLGTAMREQIANIAKYTGIEIDLDKDEIYFDSIIDVREDYDM